MDRDGTIILYYSIVNFWTWKSIRLSRIFFFKLLQTRYLYRLRNAFNAPPPSAKLAISKMQKKTFKSS